MTEEESFLNVSITFVRHPGNFQAVFSLPLNASITPCSSPRQSLSRGPRFLKTKEEAKTWIPDKRFQA